MNNKAERWCVAKEDKWNQRQREVDSRYGVLGSKPTTVRKRSQISVTSHNTSLSLAHTSPILMVRSDSLMQLSPSGDSGTRILSYHLMSPQCCGFKIPGHHPIPSQHMRHFVFRTRGGIYHFLPTGRIQSHGSTKQVRLGSWLHWVYEDQNQILLNTRRICHMWGKENCLASHSTPVLPYLRLGQTQCPYSS